MIDTSHSYPTVIMAIVSAVAVHCLVAYGLLQMTMPMLEPVKITPPIEIQMLEIAPPKVNLVPNNTPKTPPAPKSKATPTPPKPTPPKKTVEPPPKPAVEKVVQPKKAEQPKITPEPKIVALPETIPVAVKQPVVERVKKVEPIEKIEKTEPKVEPSQQVAPAVVKNTPPERTESSSEKTNASPSPSSSQNQANYGAKSDSGASQVATITQSTLRWIREPDLDFDNPDDYQPRTTTIQAILSVDNQGTITNVHIFSTGDKNLDREIKKRLKRAKLHPYTKNGIAIAAKGSIALTMSGF